MLNCVPLILCAMNLTTLLANFALIKIIYVIFFLVLVIVINVSLSRRQKKKEDEENNDDIYMSDTKGYSDRLNRITTKN